MTRLHRHLNLMWGLLALTWVIFTLTVFSRAKFVDALAVSLILGWAFVCLAWNETAS